MFNIVGVEPIRHGVGTTPAETEYGYRSLVDARRYMPAERSLYLDAETGGRKLRCHQGSYGRVTGELRWGFYPRHPKLRSATFVVVEPLSRFALEPECECHRRAGEGRPA